jgi:3-oxoacyl-[acyl-carrier protein] reductase
MSDAGVSGTGSAWPIQSFAGRVFLITGAGQGICAVLARTVAGLGARVAVADIVEARATATADRIAAAGGEALALAMDVGSEPTVQSGIDRVIAAWGKVDVLVNGAGSYGAAFRATDETPVAEWDDVFASNVRGTFLCAKVVVPHMLRAGGGRIINISSNAGRSVSPLLGCSYTAAKAAVIGITRHLSREYAAGGILVNTVCPGPVDGERVSRLVGPGKNSNALADSIPLGRLATPQDIADAIVFLASDAARFVTGAILDVSGGLVLA